MIDLSPAVADLRAAFARHELWRALAWYQVKRGNIGTGLGVAWHSLSFLITVDVLGFMYATIFHRDADLYVPYLAAGFLVWRFLSSVIIEGLGCIISARGYLTQQAMPVSVFPLKLVFYQLCLMGLNALALLAILAIGRIWILPNPAQLLLGLSILVFAGAGTAILLGVATVFQRWLRSLIPSFISLAFFVTPVIWMPNMLLGDDGHAAAIDVSADLGARGALLLVNPFYYFLEIVRGPLLGYEVPAAFWLTAVAMAASLMIAAVSVLSVTRSRILLNL